MKINVFVRTISFLSGIFLDAVETSELYPTDTILSGLAHATFVFIY